MLSGARSRLLGAAHPRPARVCVVLQPSAASSQLARPNANSTAPGLLPAAADVTYVLGQYTRGLGDRGYRCWLRAYGWDLDLLEFPAAAAEQDYAGCGDGSFGDYDGDENA